MWVIVGIKGLELLLENLEANFQFEADIDKTGDDGHGCSADLL